MPKYVTIPAVSAVILNPDNDEEIGVARFSDVVRNIFKDTRVTQGIDLFSAYDLRKELLEGKPGEVIKIEEGDHAVLASCLKRPTQFSPAFLFSPGAQVLIRAITDAPSEAPR